MAISQNIQETTNANLQYASTDAGYFTAQVATDGSLNLSLNVNATQAQAFFGNFTEAKADVTSLINQVLSDAQAKAKAYSPDTGSK